MTFRLPGPLALIVAQVDHMSGGHVEIGLGAGHTEGEHTAHGIPFPPIGERFDRLQEQLEILTGVWQTPEGAQFDHRGTYYTLERNPARPKPLQEPHPPIILGGRGPKRTPALAAAFADELNVSYLSAADTAAAFERAREACRSDRAGPRVAPSHEHSGSRAARATRSSSAASNTCVCPSRPCSTTLPSGRPATVVDRLTRLAEVGAETVYLHCWDPSDGDQLRLVADEVASAVSSYQVTA